MTISGGLAMENRSIEQCSAKERFWRKVLHGFDARRGTVREWCLWHGVSEPSFYAWRRELKRRDDALAKRSAPANGPARWLRVKVAPAPATPEVTIELADGLRVHVSIDRLADVLDVLEVRSC
jgi:hypothetical protein